MKRSKETFRFTEKMGARLRELRIKDGVTQQELAVLMGRHGKGNAFLVSRFENGHVPYPSFGFVADYLRACRASFTDISDLLNTYTSQPTVIEQRGYKRVQSLARKLPLVVGKATVKYDVAVTTARPKPEPVRKRLANVRAYARAQQAQWKLELLVGEELARAKVGSKSADGLHLRLYTRKLWRLLNRGHDERRLKPRLEKLERWAAEVGIQSHPLYPKLSAQIRSAVAEQTR